MGEIDDGEFPPGFFDRPAKPALPSRETKSASDAIAPPKFFGLDGEADTGLESIFGTVFSLQDRSTEPNATSAGSMASYSKLSKNWSTDGLAVILIEKLLRPGGWLLLDRPPPAPAT